MEDNANWNEAANSHAVLWWLANLRDRRHMGNYSTRQCVAINSQMANSMFVFLFITEKSLPYYVWNQQLTIRYWWTWSSCLFSQHLSVTLLKSIQPCNKNNTITTANTWELSREVSKGSCNYTRTWKTNSAQPRKGNLRMDSEQRNHLTRRMHTLKKIFHPIRASKNGFG